MVSFFYWVGMVTIRCRNRYKGKKNGTCGSVLAILTDWQLDALRLDPEPGIILRCRSCPKEQRWVRIRYNGDKLTFEVIEYNEKMPPEPEYSDESVYRQIG